MRVFGFFRSEGMIAFLRRVIAFARLGALIMPYAFLKIKNFNHSSLDNLVDFCFYGVLGIMKPLQDRSEISELLRILDTRKPKVIIEIGTAQGGTLFLFARIASEDATIISVDFPDRRFGGSYPGWKGLLYRAFSLPKQKLILIKADSHSLQTLEQVKDILDGREADFLFIDGDHTYDGIKMDFEMYAALVKEGGITALHDVLVHPVETGCEVSKFWNEVKQGRYESAEIVNDWDQGWGGIGLVFMNSRDDKECS